MEPDPALNPHCDAPFPAWTWLRECKQRRDAFWLWERAERVVIGDIVKILEPPKSVWVKAE